MLTVITGKPPCSAPRHSSMIRGSGAKSLHSSRPANGMPFIAARLAARMMSSRSPGVTTKVPGLSSCTVLATARAQSTIFSMRRCS